MIIPTEFQNLFQKMLLGGVESVSAYKEYCLKRSQVDQPQIDNSFLNYLSTQSTINQCSSHVLSLAATIYSQNDGYDKPPKFIELLEQLSSLPLPAAHRAYLVLPFRTQKEKILKNIKEQSQILAEQNDAAAQCNLGVMYASGRGISPEEKPKKDILAVEWYRKAAEQGHFGAQCSLGFMYANGRGISPEEMLKKDTIAVEWFRKAAVQGDAWSQSNLGFMYENDRGIPENEKADKEAIAYFWYTKCAPCHDQAKKRLNKLVISSLQLKKANMMLVRHLDYQQVNYLFKERVFKSFLLLGLVIKNKNNETPKPTLLGRLPSDLLFKIAEQLAPLSTEDLSDIYHKLIPTLSNELTFKAKYLAVNNSVALFFKSNPIAAKVKSGAPLLLGEVEKYAQEYPNSVEAQVYNRLKK